MAAAASSLLKRPKTHPPLLSLLPFPLLPQIPHPLNLNSQPPAASPAPMSSTTKLPKSR